MDAIKSYVPFLKTQYNAISKEETDEEDLQPQIFSKVVSKPSILLISIIGIIWFLTGLLVGVFLIPHYAPLNPLSTAPGVPQSVTKATTTKVWHADDLYDIHRNDSESTAAWEKIRTRFVWIENPQEKGLPASVSIGRNRQLFSVSGYHQMHCTWGLYYSWNQLKEHGSSVLDHIVPHSGGYSTIDSHFAHCLELIRQALVCHADPALEPMTSAEYDAFSVVSSGWGTQHTCRDIDKWTAWIDEHDFTKM